MIQGTRRVDGPTRRIESTQDVRFDQKAEFDQGIDCDFDFDQSWPVRGYEYERVIKEDLLCVGDWVELISEPRTVQLLHDIWGKLPSSRSGLKAPMPTHQ